MNRLQQSGLIALVLLLVIAAAGSFLGRGKVTERSIDSSAVVLEPSSQSDEVDLYSLRERLSARDFEREPLPDPLDVYRPQPVDASADPQEIQIHPLVDEPGGGAAPSPGPPPPPSSSPRTVKVRGGDSLQRLAKRELGDKDLWRLLASVNGLRSPYTIQAGQSLKLPSEEAVAASLQAMGRGSGAGASGNGGGQTGPAAAGGSRQHVVRSDETLGEISQRYYGTSKHWQHILRANGLSDPRELRAGKTITIPPPPQ